MKFPNLPEAAPLTGSEIVPLTQGGVDRRTTVQDIADLLGESVVSINGLTANTDGDVEIMAADIPYDPTASGLSATDVQSAIDEVAVGGGGGSRNAVTALSISSGVVTIDYLLGDYFTLSLTANVTSIVFTNLPATGVGASLTIGITQDATGGRTVALPSSFKATGGSDTAVQSAANARTRLVLLSDDQGARWEYAMQEVAA